MIGIYKITNKQNGKAYIGQSIHCGKRLDEHCKGNQLIDEVIQVEGIENFTFEILKEVNKQELSIWEDYYILKYNTIFPNGYNKRWNCSEVLRQVILEKSLGDNNIECQYSGSNNKEFASQDYAVPSYREVNQVIIPDCDIEILKRAAWMQRKSYCKERICTIEDLQKFYWYGQKEANEREILPKQEIFPTEVKISTLSGAQQTRLRGLKNAVQFFNERRSAWHIDEGYELDLKMIEIETRGYSDNYYKKCKEEEQEKSYRNCGICKYDNKGNFYYKTCATIYGTASTIVSRDSWISLFDLGIVNEDYIHFLDSKNNEITIRNNDDFKQLKHIDKVLIGKSVQNYLKEQEIYNKFQF